MLFPVFFILLKIFQCLDFFSYCFHRRHRMTLRIRQNKEYTIFAGIGKRSTSTFKSIYLIKAITFFRQKTALTYSTNIRDTYDSLYLHLYLIISRPHTLNFSSVVYNSIYHLFNYMPRVLRPFLHKHNKAQNPNLLVSDMLLWLIPEYMSFLKIYALFLFYNTRNKDSTFKSMHYFFKLQIYMFFLILSAIPNVKHDNKLNLNTLKLKNGSSP